MPHSCERALARRGRARCTRTARRPQEQRMGNARASRAMQIQPLHAGSGSGTPHEAALGPPTNGTRLLRRALPVKLDIHFKACVPASYSFKGTQRGQVPLFANAGVAFLLPRL